MEKVQFLKPRQHRGTPVIKFLFVSTGFLSLFCLAGYYFMDWYSRDYVDKERALGRFLDDKRWVEKRALMSRLSVWNPLKPVQLKIANEFETVADVDCTAAQNVPGAP